jgi:selenide,water dikinase
LTDVTGFGLLGHANEMANGSGLTAVIELAAVPLIPGLDHYLQQGAIPGGTHRNWKSYGQHISPISEHSKHLLADPQTSGGLLVAVAPTAVEEYKALAKASGLPHYATTPIGFMAKKGPYAIEVRE